MDLAQTLQRLYDIEINVTITMLWDDGFDFALISYMEWEDAGQPTTPGRRAHPLSLWSVLSDDLWYRIDRADQLANANSRRRPW